MSNDGSKTEESAPTTLFNVGMTCGGCAKACTRILSKIDGKHQVRSRGLVCARAHASRVATYHR